MSIASSPSFSAVTRPAVVVPLAGAVAATLDLIYASTFWGYVAGLGPRQILQSIASGWLGRDAAFAGGNRSAALGLVSHYGIAIAMATMFYLASRRWPALARRPLPFGALYGIVLYVVMTYVVLPLSNAGAPAFPAWQWQHLSHIAAHMFLVGVPCALGAQRAMRHRRG